ncbi:MAG: pyridoxamine 5'-phosphate oxidase family protein [Micropepsaceae bacterium]
MTFYHEDQRKLQNRFGSTALADRLEQVTHRTRLTDDDKGFVEASSFFFLATSDAEGRPDCSYKGGAVGFVRVLAPDLLVFPDYDGNGMFRSLGNIVTNPSIGMLFIRMGDAAKRLRINGSAAVHLDDPLISEIPGAQAIVRVTPQHIFPNCPRYVHDLVHGKPSMFTPEMSAPPVEPAWKSFDSFKDVVPPRRR